MGLEAEKQELLKRSILSRMLENPRDCTVFREAIANTVYLSPVGKKSEEVFALIRNLAMIHKESGCDFEANHSQLQQILA